MAYNFVGYIPVQLKNGNHYPFVCEKSSSAKIVLPEPKSRGGDKMPTPTPNPLREALIEATSRIVCAVIESGKIPSIEAKEIGTYFSQVYTVISQSVKN